MAQSITKTILTESVELVKDTGKEMRNQLKEAGKDIVKTVGINANEVSPINKTDLTKLSKEDNSLKGAEIAKIKQTLFQEQKSAEQSAFARTQQEAVQRREHAQVVAEREQKKQAFVPQTGNPLDAVGSKVTGLKALFKNKKETKQQ